MIEGRLYRLLTDEELIICLVCERKCSLRKGMKGLCGNYVNLDDKLYSIGYGKLSAIESRPIEIKPLFHYWPNSTALTFSGFGCNFYCPWCQNYFLSFRHPSDEPVIQPSYLVRLAKSLGDEGLSASFNEPTINYEYLIDVATLARHEGLYLTIVTNGYQSVEALNELVESGFDGWSIDIKGCPSMKRALPNIDHNKIFRNAKLILNAGGHVEMVYLIITKTNDHDECVDWIIRKHVNELGPEIPLHVNRYYPAHKWSEEQTPIKKLLEVRDKAKKEGIEYVYVGNVGIPELETTKCPKCGKTLIARYNYRVIEFNLLRDGNIYKCPRCNTQIPIRGNYVINK